MEATGIIWIGPVGDMGGYGNVSRGLLKCFWTLNVPVHVLNSGDMHPEVSRAELLQLAAHQAPLAAVGERPYLFIHSEPKFFGATLDTLHPIHRKIGVTIFETDRIPGHWVDPCNQLDEIWVPSEFNMKTFAESGVDSSRLRKVPYALDVEQLNEEVACTGDFPFPDDIRGFKFLYTCAFDFRKGIDLLVQGYCSAFTDEDDVSLILKIYVPQWNEDFDVVQYIRSVVPNGPHRPHILVIIEKLPREVLLSLYRSVDCYISTDRANGWGMPCMEMMAIGKPAVTINWSGSTEFMRSNNSFLIYPDAETEPVHPLLQARRPAEYEGHRWAKVSVSAVSSVMREVFSNKRKRNQVALMGKQSITSDFSTRRIAEVIERML